MATLGNKLLIHKLLGDSPHLNHSKGVSAEVIVGEQVVGMVLESCTYTTLITLLNKYSEYVSMPYRLKKLQHLRFNHFTMSLILIQTFVNPTRLW